MMPDLRSVFRYLPGGKRSLADLEGSLKDAQAAHAKVRERIHHLERTERPRLLVEGELEDVERLDAEVKRLQLEDERGKAIISRIQAELRDAVRQDTRDRASAAVRDLPGALESLRAAREEARRADQRVEDARRRVEQIASPLARVLADGSEPGKPEVPESLAFRLDREAGVRLPLPLKWPARPRSGPTVRVLEDDSAA